MENKIPDYNLSRNKTLKPEQQEGIHFILNNSPCILAFQTGLGKTLTSLTATLHMMKKDPELLCFIFCPLKALKAFETELIQTYGIIPSVLETDRQEIHKGSRFCIVTFSSLPKHLAVVKKCCEKNRIVAIIDEVHNIISETSSLAKQMKFLRPLFYNVIACTATPVENDLEKVFPLCNYVRPFYFGSDEWNFKHRYFKMQQKTVHAKTRGGRHTTRNIWEIVGIKEPELLSAKLNKICIVRSVKYDVDFIYKQVEQTPEERAYYAKAAKGLMNLKDADEKQFVSRLYDLQRVVDGSSPEMERKIYSKERLLAKVLQEIMHRNEAVLIYTELYDTVDKLTAVLNSNRKRIGFNRILYVTGKTPRPQRLLVEHQLGPKDIVIITAAGSESINLQKANNLILYDCPFNIKTCLQAIGRITRVTTEYSSQSVYVLEVCETIDTYRRMLMEERAAIIKQLLGASSTLPGEVSRIDRENISKLRRLLLWKNK